MAPWILSFLPPHDSYVEPYGGSAAVLLRKTRSLIEAYNDLDGDVVAFFRVLRERTDELIRAIRWTPFAHAERQLSLQPCDDELEAARRLYVRSFMSINGPTAQFKSGWRRQKVFSRGRSGKSSMKTAARSFMEVEHLYQVAERLRGVTIESMDALDLIRVYDNERALFYVDPPYVFATRKRLAGGTYRHEMADDQHRELAGVLRSCTGMVLLSGYDCELYRDLFGDWQRYQRDVRTNSNTSRMATETLWLNPAASAARNIGQLSLLPAGLEQ